MTIDDLRETITLQTFGFDGQVNAKDSTLFDLSLASAFFDGKVDDGRAEVRQLTVDGPDVAGTAAGALSFDDAPGSTSTSDLTYRFTVPDLARLGKRVEQPFAGRAELGGKLTGNFAALETTGTAHIEPARYGDTAQAAIVDATYKVRLPDLEIANVRVETHVEASQHRDASWRECAVAQVVRRRRPAGRADAAGGQAAAGRSLFRRRASEAAKASQAARRVGGEQSRRRRRRSRSRSKSCRPT